LIAVQSRKRRQIVVTPATQHQPSCCNGHGVSILGGLIEVNPQPHHFRD
jgi:hypothetical protein